MQDTKQLAAKLREERDAMEITLEQLHSGELRCWAARPEYADVTDDWIAMLERHVAGTSALIAVAERSLLERVEIKKGECQARPR